MGHASSLDQAIQSLFHFERLLSDQPVLQRLDAELNTVIRVLPLPRESSVVRRLWAGLFMTGLFRLARRFDLSAPTQMNFDFPAPPYAAEYLRIFGPCVRFDEPHTDFVVDKEMLAVPAPNGDPELFRAMREIAERRITRLTNNLSYATRVRDFISKHGPPCGIEMKTVAAGLGLSVRSLRRRLAEEGHTYNAIAKKTLASIAKERLGCKRYTIQEVAYEMGFADATGFHHAFSTTAAKALDGSDSTCVPSGAF